MNYFTAFLDFLSTGRLIYVSLLVFLINFTQLVLVAILGNWLVVKYNHRRISEIPQRISSQELFLTCSTLVINSVITILGCLLWRNDWIVIQGGTIFKMCLDMVVFVLFIDFSMYLLHRVAHIDRLFPFLHKTHHLYEDPRPITLFVLNPIETLSFGLLWLGILMAYPSSWPGVFLFMTFNLLFGMMGHLGVEPFSYNALGKWYVKLFSTSTFHAMHHKYERYNFGFYLVVWDKVFSTLHPLYYDRFRRGNKREEV